MYDVLQELKRIEQVDMDRFLYTEELDLSHKFDFIVGFNPKDEKTNPNAKTEYYFVKKDLFSKEHERKFYKSIKNLEFINYNPNSGIMIFKKRK